MSTELLFMNSSSAKVKWPKLHLEILCNGMSRQRVTTRVETRGELVVAYGAPTPEGRAIAHDVNAWGPKAHSLKLFGGMDLEAIVAHEYRPCRNCALEQVLDLALNSEATATVPVTFSGQFVPEEIGVNVFEWEAISQSGVARMRRIAARSGLQVTDTVIGPVVYGLVAPSTYQLLARNLRTYRLDRDLADRVRGNDDKVAFAIESYWMMRNSRPPELYADEHVDVERLASALAHR